MTSLAPRDRLVRDGPRNDHTPTPWAVETRPDVNHGLPCIVKSNGHLLATLSDRNEANAAYIVRAVNAHEALVEALERILNLAEATPINRPLRAVGLLARAALDQAKGEK